MLSACGSVAGSIFTQGPSITRCQSGRAAASCAKKVQVHPLVDDAEEAEPRVRNAGLILGFGRHGSRRGEVRDIDAARKREDPTMPLALRFVQTLAAREDEIGAVQQLFLVFEKFRRRILERRQLVHAVEHDGARRQVRAQTSTPSACNTRQRTLDAVNAVQLVQKASHLVGDCARRSNPTADAGRKRTRRYRA